jgi:hypothetical protein
MLDQMTPRQQIFAVVASVALLLFIVEMVRRRRLREEYSWLWIATGVAILVLSIWFGLLKWLTHLIGAVTPVSTFFMFGILFLVVTNIYFSIKISTLTTQVKNQAQRLAILDHHVQELRHRDAAGSPAGDDGAGGVEATAPGPPSQHGARPGAGEPA